MKRKAKSICMFLLFVVGIILVIYGQKTVGYFHLFLQIIGLIIMLTVLGIYNKQYE